MEEFNKWLTETLGFQNIPFLKQENNVIAIPSQELSFRFAGINQIISFKKNEIIIWEDQWLTKPEIVKSKIFSKLGLLQKIPARLCTLKRINKTEADNFLEENHLQGATGSKTKYGIFLPEKYHRILKQPVSQQDLLVGVATFSGKRKFRDDSISYELLRYCVAKGFTIQGGFSKVLKRFIDERNPDSIMTYTDLDWYTTGTYDQMGFEEVSILPELYFKLSPEGKRIKTENQPYDVKSKGSVKLIWKKQ